GVLPPPRQRRSGGRNLHPSHRWPVSWREIRRRLRRRPGAPCNTRRTDTRGGAAPARRTGNTWTTAGLTWDGLLPCECAGASSTFYVSGHPWELFSVTSISSSSYPTHASADCPLTACIGTALCSNPCHNADTLPGNPRHIAPAVEVRR